MIPFGNAVAKMFAENSIWNYFWHQAEFLALISPCPLQNKYLLHNRNRKWHELTWNVIFSDKGSSKFLAAITCLVCHCFHLDSTITSLSILSMSLFCTSKMQNPKMVKSWDFSCLGFECDASDVHGRVEGTLVVKKSNLSGDIKLQWYS